MRRDHSKDHAITKAEYDAKMAGRTRPLTDAGIGARTAGRRKADAENSAIVGKAFGHGELWPGDEAPDIKVNTRRTA